MYVDWCLVLSIRYKIFMLGGITHLFRFAGLPIEVPAWGGPFPRLCDDALDDVIGPGRVVELNFNRSLCGSMSNVFFQLKSVSINKVSYTLLVDKLNQLIFYKGLHNTSPAETWENVLLLDLAKTLSRFTMYAIQYLSLLTNFYWVKIQYVTWYVLSTCERQKVTIRFYAKSMTLRKRKPFRFFFSLPFNTATRLRSYICSWPPQVKVKPRDFKSVMTRPSRKLSCFLCMILPTSYIMPNFEPNWTEGQFPFPHTSELMWSSRCMCASMLT